MAITSYTLSATNKLLSQTFDALYSYDLKVRLTDYFYYVEQAVSISYYNDKIQKNPDWLFAGVYVDDGISGTGTAKREDFNRMIADADAGKIDIILTKSISRFARNTVDLLETVWSSVKKKHKIK